MHTTPPVVLVAMPFAGVTIPSIQLPTLQTWARHHDIRVDTRHLYLKAAEAYGLANYHTLIYPPSDSYIAQLAFTRYLFPDHWHTNLDHITHHFTHTIPPTSSLTFDDYLHRTDTFYHDTIDHLDWHHYDLIGFTCNYGQLIPSLAIAKHIKQTSPDKKIVLGGGRTTGDLGRGILQAFDFIDYIVSGDGEDALVQLATAPDDPATIPGLIYRTTNGIRSNTPQPIDLATSPPSSYDPFFNQLNTTSPELQQFFHYHGRLPIEISRGCWWNHCTFCNLNLQHPTYREKPIPHIIDEIQWLTDRYHILDYQLIGNTLPRTQYRTLFTELKSLGKDHTFFVEARAGQLTSHDYHLMSEAGFTMIQTGIEALSHHYLRTMNKGTRLIDNIAALKHSTQHGIHNHYNLIVHYPNEEPIDYQETATIAQQLKGYIDPPQLCDLHVMHGSTIHHHPDQYNIQRLTPTTIDRLLYPPEALAKNFTFIYDFTTQNPTPTTDWEGLIHDWTTTREAAETDAIRTHATTDRLAFYSVDGGTFMKVYDKRDPAHIRILELNAIERDLLLACTDIISYQRLQEQFSSIPEFKLTAVLQSFEHAGIVFHEDDLYLSLPLQYRQSTTQETNLNDQETPQALVHP